MSYGFIELKRFVLEEFASASHRGSRKKWRMGQENLFCDTHVSLNKQSKEYKRAIDSRLRELRLARNGPRDCDKPIPFTVTDKPIEPVFNKMTRVEVVAMRAARPRYEIVPVAVEKSTCDMCGGAVEIRPGVSRPVHANGSRWCAKNKG